jgi:hypothetical protein
MAGSCRRRSRHARPCQSAPDVAPWTEEQLKQLSRKVDDMEEQQVGLDWRAEFEEDLGSLVDYVERDTETLQTILSMSDEEHSELVGAAVCMVARNTVPAPATCGVPACATCRGWMT